MDIIVAGLLVVCLVNKLMEGKLYVLLPLLLEGKHWNS